MNESGGINIAAGAGTSNLAHVIQSITKSTKKNPAKSLNKNQGNLPND
jgi:hypothetical protein